MRKSKFSEHQIIAILKAVEAGRTVKDVCREHEISDATYYQWKSKYGGMQASHIKRLRELEDENRRLKQMSADLLCFPQNDEPEQEQNRIHYPGGHKCMFRRRTVCHLRIP
jgi:putative transposase